MQEFREKKCQNDLVFVYDFQCQNDLDFFFYDFQSQDDLVFANDFKCQNDSVLLTISML
jgi:hypothetical protein